jgi:hypothetical protein
MSEPTVYLNEEGDYWVEVAGTPYLAARRTAKRIASESGDEKIRYLGKEQARLTEHEVGCNGDDCYRTVLAYHFEGSEA